MNRQHRGDSNRSQQEMPDRDERGRFTSEHQNASRNGNRDFNGYRPHERNDTYDDYDRRDENISTHRRGPNYGYGSDEEDDRGARRPGGEERERDEHGRFISERSGGERAGNSSGNLQWNEHSDGRSAKGPHHGKGPKGYRRSDERIEEEVNQALSDDDELDASSIEVKVSGGDVTLTGTVSSRADKRRAEDCIDTISGVNNVENLLRVDRNSDSSSAKEKSGEEKSSESSSSKSKSRQASHANA
jgi:osmotically-inducible protein OsmY